jgi:hypothetical protein
VTSSSSRKRARGFAIEEHLPTQPPTSKRVTDSALAKNFAMGAGLAGKSRILRSLKKDEGMLMGSQRSLTGLLWILCAKKPLRIDN